MQEKDKIKEIRESWAPYLKPGGNDSIDLAVYDIYTLLEILDSRDRMWQTVIEDLARSCDLDVEVDLDGCWRLTYQWPEIDLSVPHTITGE